MLKVPAPTRVPFASAHVGAQRVELFVSPEWSRYFESLNNEVSALAAALAESAQHAALMGDGGDTPDALPGPPGPQGLQGDAGLPLFLLQDDPGEQPMPPMPGPQGARGDAGLALFMLQDDATEQASMVPPCVDNVYVPLNTKDASNGVPGLTLLKLNLKNAAGTITSWFASIATVARTWTMPDKDGTVAMTSDFAAPPAIGNTTAAAGSFTTLTANTLATSAGFGCNGKPAQASAASGGAVAITAATNAAPYGFTTAAQANDIVTKLNTVIATLVANGIQS